MGTVIFVVLRIARIFDTDYDWPIGCMLVSLDSITFGLYRVATTLRSVLGVRTEGGREEETLGAEPETKTESASSEESDSEDSDSED